VISERYKPHSINVTASLQGVRSKRKREKVQEEWHGKGKNKKIPGNNDR
jgi:hypothetical protein